MSNSKKINIPNIICCVGSAHIDELKKELSYRGADVKIVKFMDKIDEKLTDKENTRIRVYFE